MCHVTGTTQTSNALSMVTNLHACIDQTDNLGHVNPVTAQMGTREHLKKTKCTPSTSKRLQSSPCMVLYVICVLPLQTLCASAFWRLASKRCMQLQRYPLHVLDGCALHYIHCRNDRLLIS
jgi:hypothetical protein